MSYHGLGQFQYLSPTAVTTAAGITATGPTMVQWQPTVAPTVAPTTREAALLAMAQAVAAQAAAARPTMTQVQAPSVAPGTPVDPSRLPQCPDGSSAIIEWRRLDGSGSPVYSNQVQGPEWDDVGYVCQPSAALAPEVVEPELRQPEEQIEPPMWPGETAPPLVPPEPAEEKQTPWLMIGLGVAGLGVVGYLMMNR